MLESMTIFSKGGLVMYQYTAYPSVLDKDSGGAGGGARYTQHALNNHLCELLLKPSSSSSAIQKGFLIKDSISFCWKDCKDWFVVALYPDIMFEQPRKYMQDWARKLVEQTAEEYQRFVDSQPLTGSRPDPELFDKVFLVLYNQSKSNRQDQQQKSTSKKQPPVKKDSNDESSKKNKKPGKEKRTWHDGNAKVTDKAMAELDKSEAVTEEALQESQNRALQEARSAYLPTAEDLQEQQDESDKVKKDQDEVPASFSFFSNIMANKVIADADLDEPLQKMEELLTSKNVAQSIAHDLCNSVRQNLRGKKLNTLYRVQTAVRQGLEHSLTKLLEESTKMDLLTRIFGKQRAGDYGFIEQAPYVIVVLGINGVGKSTSLAKLAYFLQSNGCSPMLVAGDTFRSGAVEQLSLHGQCLNIPVFSQGYSKDPSAVAQAAIEQATKDQHDVVLIDTAGRMQNNRPLMQALGKLVQVNQPDFCILVCEALVGNDGLDQFRMFQQALGGRDLDGLVLTKFDTVSDKVGAALTLTHETGAPIVFTGTGQKYHHLEKLSVPFVLKSLFS